MNATRLATAATFLVMLCATASAETMSTKDDPLAVPVSVDTASGNRAADPWTAERLARAQPRPAPDVDPAAVRAASAGGFRSGDGPEGHTAAVVLVADNMMGIEAHSSPGGDPEYWTPQRMRSATPMPLPEVSEDAFRTLIKPGQKNR